MGSLRRILFLTGVLLLAPIGSFAAAGKEGASFLDIPVGARPAALGSAYSALAEDAYAPVWNPAGLGWLRQTAVATQYLQYVGSIHYEFLSLVHPFAPGSAWGASAQYLGSGPVPETDATGQSLGDFSVQYGAYTLAYGRAIGSRASLGMSGKWIHGRISDVSAHAFAADVGGLFHATARWTWAGTLTNLGSSLSFLDQGDPLPLSLHLGTAYDSRHARLTAEGVYPRGGPLAFRLGAEWNPMTVLALRAGFRTDTIREGPSLAGWTAGIGLAFLSQELSYAWLPLGELGNTHYLSWTLRFGSATSEPKRSVSPVRLPLREDREFQELKVLLRYDEGPAMANRAL